VPSLFLLISSLFLLAPSLLRLVAFQLLPVSLLLVLEDPGSSTREGK
jgi:hypothetical protein